MAPRSWAPRTRRTVGVGGADGRGGWAMRRSGSVSGMSAAIADAAPRRRIKAAEAVVVGCVIVIIGGGEKRQEVAWEEGGRTGGWVCRPWG